MISQAVNALADYAVEHSLITSYDRVYAVNSILGELHTDEYDENAVLPASAPKDLDSILAELCDYAVKARIIEDDTTTERDLFDTKLMGLLTPRPGEVVRIFNEKYEKSPREATDWFYTLCRDDNYIRTARVALDQRWKYESPYGTLDITVNLSKPEKDPKAIAAAKNAPSAGYPKCALCRENEGFAGSLTKPARENLRLVPLKLSGEDWYMQYSPYVYYNEHCIVLNSKHAPMKVSRASFERLLDFVTVFPHYFIGSNADLPIVGGSILTHDHFQGGRCTFAMENAPIEKELRFPGYPGVDGGIVKWPLSVIRLRSQRPGELVSLADRILSLWRGYSDGSAAIFASTGSEPHNTITPIARRRGSAYELDLVLRNNIKTAEHPDGLFHPHADKHNIKKENIGLIEVMGLAVLPSRLKTEMDAVAGLLAGGKAARELRMNPLTAKHADWVAAFAEKRGLTGLAGLAGLAGLDKNRIIGILHEEIGRTFTKVLEDAGVFKCTAEGREAFLRFTATI